MIAVYEEATRGASLTLRRYTYQFRAFLGIYFRAEQAEASRALLAGGSWDEIKAKLEYDVPPTLNEFLSKKQQKHVALLFNEMTRITLEIMSDQGNLLASWVRRKLGLRAVYNGTQEKSVLFARYISMGLVKAITATRRDTLRRLFSRTFLDDLSIAEATKLIRQCVVLTPTYAKWTKNVYLRNLEEYGKKTALEEAKKYAEHLKDNRAKTIARTEIQQAYNRAQIDATRQLIESGIIQAAYKQWRMTNWKDNWPSSILYNGTTIPLNDFWGGKYFIPDEINEMCVAVPMFVYELPNNRRIAR